MTTHDSISLRQPRFFFARPHFILVTKSLTVPGDIISIKVYHSPIMEPKRNVSQTTIVANLSDRYMYVLPKLSLKYRYHIRSTCSSPSVSPLCASSWGTLLALQPYICFRASQCQGWSSFQSSVHSLVGEIKIDSLRAFFLRLVWLQYNGTSCREILQASSPASANDIARPQIAPRPVCRRKCMACFAMQ